MYRPACRDFELYFSGHADYLYFQRRIQAVIGTNEVGTSDGRTRWEQGVRHMLADDGHVLRCGGVPGAEGAASQNGNLHGREVAIADDVVVHIRVAIHRHAGNADVGVPTALKKAEGGEAEAPEGDSRI